MPPHSNSLDNFDFAMRHQFRKYQHIQIIETASILHLPGILDDDERVHITANDSRHDTASSQLGHSPLSQPTKATLS